MMKHFLKLSLFTVTLALSSCDALQDIAKNAEDVIGSLETEDSKLTNSQVISGLKEALTVGIKNGASKASVVDGFFKNSAIKLPFPPDAIKMREKAIEWGLSDQVSKIELTLNRAAEEAAKESVPIFVNAITSMSIGDGFTILKGADNAATNYLRDKTTSQLVQAFNPKVKAAIDKVELTKYWEPVATRYNQLMAITGGKTVNADLTGYVTDRGISGLFYLVEGEEKKIRKDPIARVTDLLKKVFGSVD